MLEHFDPNDIQDLEGARQAIIHNLNLVEELASENRALREENQRLRDELNRLKGEQGKPRVKASKKSGATNTSDHSSEQARRRRQKRTRRSKVKHIQIDRECKLELDRTQLPEDAEFKGYVPVVVQDVRLATDNIRFLKEKRYSPSQKQTYLAKLPIGYEGEFGPGVHALVRVLYHAVNTSEPKIVEFFDHVGAHISSGQVSNLLIKGQDRFHAEKDDIYEAGLRSSPWQHIDETGTRVNGVNQYCHVVCSPLYTAYLTTEKKNRLTVIDVLTNLRPRAYLLLAKTYDWLRQTSVSESVLGRLQRLSQNRTFDDEQFNRLLDEHLTDVNAQHRRRILEAAAITSYQTQQEIPVVQLLLSDDAPQFKRVTDELALCWVHDARHYKKLTPAVAQQRAARQKTRATEIRTLDHDQAGAHRPRGFLGWMDQPRTGGARKEQDRRARSIPVFGISQRSAIAQPDDPIRKPRLVLAIEVCQVHLPLSVQVIPPSTITACPVMYDAASPARNQTTSATSPGCPALPRDTFSANQRCPASSGRLDSVPIQPGTTHTTRMPCGPTSRARHFVNAIRPALEAA